MTDEEAAKNCGCWVAQTGVVCKHVTQPKRPRKQRRRTRLALCPGCERLRQTFRTDNRCQRCVQMGRDADTMKRLKRKIAYRKRKASQAP